MAAVVVEGSGPKEVALPARSTVNKVLQITHVHKSESIHDIVVVIKSEIILFYFYRNC